MTNQDPGAKRPPDWPNATTIDDFLRGLNGRPDALEQIEGFWMGEKIDPQASPEDRIKVQRFAEKLHMRKR